MELRWSSDAADDLERIANYLFDKTPDSAAQIVRRVHDQPAVLKTFPNPGAARQEARNA